jgi:cation diffusion facilitator family transporter
VFATDSIHKQRVALASVVASGSLAAAKLVVGLMTGSLGILSEAIHSFMDLAASMITFFAVRAADRPADAEHPYGHAKFESVAAFVECGLLLGAAGWIAMEAIRRLATGAPGIEVTPAAIGVILVSIVVDFWRSRSLGRTAKATGSQALEADALHFTSDMLASGVVLVGLALVASGLPVADSVAALIVSGFIAWAAWRLGSRTFASLVDTAPQGLADRIEAAGARIEGVISVRQVRARPAGSSVFADVVVDVDRALPLDRVAAIKQDLNAALVAAVPNLELTITTDPVPLGDETIATRVRLLAANRGIAVHHLTIQRLGERISISLDLEVDGGLPLAEAHALATELEEEIEAAFGGAAEVETHIEPLTPNEVRGRDVAEPVRQAIAEALARFAAIDGTVHDVHDVRVRDTTEGLVVNFHAGVAAETTVRAAHDMIDAVERRLRLARPDIARVVGHAEPRTPDRGIRTD